MFTRLDSRSTDPRLFINRSHDVDTLAEQLDAHLSVDDPSTSMAIRITGEKGSGKTIFLRHVIQKVQAAYPTALYVNVDCRMSGTSRRVLQRIADATVAELDRLLKAGTGMRPALVDAARAVSALATFDDVELKKAHEHIIQFKAAAGLSVDAALLGQLKSQLGVSFERSDRQISQLTGSIRIDERKLGSLLNALFHDIRREGINIVLIVDNLDEMRPDYRLPAQRDTAREEAMWVLELRQSPVLMIACMRTYFADVARDIGKKWHLDALPSNVLLAIAERRAKEEPSNVQTWFGSNEVNSLAHMLAGVAPTPLAYLDWLEFFCREKAFDKQRRAKAIQRFVEAEQTGLVFSVLEQLGREMDTNHELDRDELLRACGGRESEIVAIIDAYAVLPNNLWNPTRYRLDPALFLLLPSVRSRLM